MNAQFRTWGNSLAVRIPASIAKQLTLFDGKSADIQVRDNSLVVIPVDEQPVYDINDLVAQITPENVHAEIDTGDPVGNEAW
jgi:antitoxin MazE